MNGNENHFQFATDPTEGQEKPNLDRIFTGTGADRHTVDALVSTIIENLNVNRTVSISDGLIRRDLSVAANSIAGPRYPVIVLINGVGASGKDTLVKAASAEASTINIDSVSEVKAIAEQMIRMDEARGQTLGRTHSNDKDNEFRTLLSSLKSIWADFSDGPNNLVEFQVGQACMAVEDQTRSTDIIFIHVREIANIRRLKDRFTALGLAVITLLVKGINNPEDFDNGSDRQAYDYNYDITINNTFGKLNIFTLQSALFGHTVAAVNSVFGIVAHPQALPAEDQKVVDLGRSEVMMFRPDNSSDSTLGSLGD